MSRQFKSEAEIGSLGQRSDAGCDWLLWGTLAIASLLFLLLEYRFPYYFMQDDGLDYFLPAYVHDWRALMHGKLALYDFHVFAGVPQLAVGQAGTFYGPQYVAMGLSRLFWGNPFAALDIMAWIHILLAVAGTYVLLKHMGADGIAVVLAGFLP